MYLVLDVADNMDMLYTVVINMHVEVDLTKATVSFMYWRPILCTLYGAVDFLNVLKKYIMYL